MRSVALSAVAALALMGSARAEFYVGPFAAVTLLDQTRTVGSTKLVDLGGDVYGGGLRGGWGTRLSSGIYLGAEVEGYVLSGRSRAVVNGVPYSYSVRGGVAGHARAGWMSPEGALLFLRGGVVSYDTNQGWQTMPAVGVGMEVPVGRGWAGRIDGVYAWNDIEHYSLLVGAVYRW